MLILYSSTVNGYLVVVIVKTFPWRQSVLPVDFRGDLAALQTHLKIAPSQVQSREHPLFVKAPKRKFLG